MIRIYDDTKIYVQCPRNVQSGGAELLHQLVSYLRDNGKEAYIVYYVGENRDTVPVEYQKYNIAIADKIEDSDHNISVLYETVFYQAAKDTKIQKILWWLSVDNYYRCGLNFLKVRDIAKWDKKIAIETFLRRIAYLILKGKNLFKDTISTKEFAGLDVLCAYQSEYAQHFLQANGFKEMVPLKDYINVEHCSEFTIEGREDIILYNPKKGYEYTKKLIDATPDLKWVALENMSRQQLIDIMKRSKIYVDFGNHPGKDRLPRECAMNGLCIITGSRGAAYYFEDVWIENRYKFDEKNSNISDIAMRLRDVLKNYKNYINDFQYYRGQIVKEKEEFEMQVRELFLNPFLKR